MAEIGPPSSLPFNVAITCGAFCAPGQNGQYPGWLCRSTSSPTMTQERVIGSLRNSMLPLGKQRQALMVNRDSTNGPARHDKSWDEYRSFNITRGHACMPAFAILKPLYAHAGARHVAD